MLLLMMKDIMAFSWKRSFFWKTQFLIFLLYVTHVLTDWFSVINLVINCPCIPFCLLYYMQVGNNERRDEMPYDEPPKTDFQHLIRSPREGQLLCFFPKYLLICVLDLLNAKYSVLVQHLLSDKGMHNLVRFDLTQPSGFESS